MKITQGQLKPTFEPITIVLETYGEAEALKLVLNVYTALKETVEKHTSSYQISERRKQLISDTFGAMWDSAVIDHLHVSAYDYEK